MWGCAGAQGSAFCVVVLLPPKVFLHDDMRLYQAVPLGQTLAICGASKLKPLAPLLDCPRLDFLDNVSPFPNIDPNHMRDVAGPLSILANLRQDQGNVQPLVHDHPALPRSVPNIRNQIPNSENARLAALFQLRQNDPVNRVNPATGNANQRHADWITCP